MATGFDMVFVDLDAKGQGDAIELVQRIAAIEGELAAISDARAIEEAGWRKKENYLKTELGKLQILLRDMRKPNITEIP